VRAPYTERRYLAWTARPERRVREELRLWDRRAEPTRAMRTRRPPEIRRRPSFSPLCSCSVSARGCVVLIRSLLAPCRREGRAYYSSLCAESHPYASNRSPTLCAPCCRLCEVHGLRSFTATTICPIRSRTTSTGTCYSAKFCSQRSRIAQHRSYRACRSHGYRLQLHLARIWQCVASSISSVAALDLAHRARS
jgi:hypothetical protein